MSCSGVGIGILKFLGFLLRSKLPAIHFEDGPLNRWSDHAGPSGGNQRP